MSKSLVSRKCNFICKQKFDGILIGGTNWGKAKFYLSPWIHAKNLVKVITNKSYVNIPNSSDLQSLEG